VSYLENFEDLRSLYVHLELNALNYEYTHEIADLFRQLRDVKREENSDVAEKAQWETDAFYFNTLNGELGPFYIMTDNFGKKIEAPVLGCYDERAYNYLRERLDNTKNPLLKSRYAHILWEPEEEAVKVGARQYLPARLPVRRKCAIKPEEGLGTMRHCILEALNKSLEGGEGNDMLVAVVCEALAAGKKREEIIHLFEGQADFDETISAKYVDYIIAKDYSPWKCETLHDRCSTLVDCENCPIRNIESLENIVEQATAR
jgi:hypothetical protein